MAHILEVGHESVLEHSSVTFYVRDVSRSLTHELVRHRHLSYSQRSQRYVDEYNNDIVIPPDIKNNAKAMNLLSAMDSRTKTMYKELVSVLTAGGNGLPRKRARSAARAVLLGSQSTAIVVTGNLRAWRDFLKKRHHVAADEEIQIFAQAVLYHLRELAPHSVQDIPAEPYGYTTTV
jgi:thymidylate synthase (FAD)